MIIQKEKIHKVIVRECVSLNCMKIFETFVNKNLRSKFKRGNSCNLTSVPSSTQRLGYLRGLQLGSFTEIEQSHQ